MITNLIPRTLKSWLKLRINQIVTQSPITRNQLPDDAIKYVPYKKHLNAFVIPKTYPNGSLETCRIGLPVPPKKLWLGYGDTEEEYLLSGETHVEKMIDIVKASDFSFEEANRMLDFGCGGGRMIRHLKEFAMSSEIWGTDISTEHIYWCAQYLSPPFHFATTTTIPHLPFEDRYFDFIYVGSVFTHIDDLAKAWLLELRRILSPKGRLYITIHDKHTIELRGGILTGKESPTTKMNYDELYRQSKNSFGMLVLGRDTQSRVFYDIDYFCKTVDSLFDIVSITQEAYGTHTVILLKRNTPKNRTAKSNGGCVS